MYMHMLTERKISNITAVHRNLGKLSLNKKYFSWRKYCPNSKNQRLIYREHQFSKTARSGGIRILNWQFKQIWFGSEINFRNEMVGFICHCILSLRKKEGKHFFTNNFCCLKINLLLKHIYPDLKEKNNS